MKLYDFHIIIVTFNRAPLVLKSLESVLKQKEITIYVEIINNGSTDDSSELLDGVVKNYKSTKNHIAVHNLPRNIDPLDALKQTIRTFKGYYFNILGDDDHYLSESLLYDIRNLFLSNSKVNTVIGGFNIIPFDKFFKPIDSKIEFHKRIYDQYSCFGISDPEICAIQALQWNLRIKLPVHLENSMTRIKYLSKNIRFHSSSTFFRVSSITARNLTLKKLFMPPFGDIGFVQLFTDHHVSLYINEAIVAIGKPVIRETKMISSPSSNTKLIQYLRSSLEYKSAFNLPLFNVIATNQFLGIIKNNNRLSLSVDRGIRFYFSTIKSIFKSNYPSLHKISLILKLSLF